jgi:hypothetical protein
VRSLLQVALGVALLAGTYAMTLVATAIDLAIACAPVLVALAWHPVLQAAGFYELIGSLLMVTGACLVVIVRGLLVIRRAGERSIPLPEEDAGPLRKMINEIAGEADTSPRTSCALPRRPMPG